jgi:hypothetical protein
MIFTGFPSPICFIISFLFLPANAFSVMVTTLPGA